MVLHMDESCHVYKYVMANTWMSHVAQMGLCCRASQSATSEKHSMEFGRCVGHVGWIGSESISSYVQEKESERKRE